MKENGYWSFNDDKLTALRSVLPCQSAILCSNLQQRAFCSRDANTYFSLTQVELDFQIRWRVQSVGAASFFALRCTRHGRSWD